MMNWKKNCMAATLVATLLVPTAAIAHGSDDFEGYHHDRGGAHIHAKHPHMMLEPVHRQTYFTLLSEKYTPESTKEWKAVFAERERLVNEMKSLSGEVRSKQEPKKDITKDEKWKNTHREEMKKWHEQKVALYEEFTDAIRSQEQTKIKTVLPKLLQQIKQGNKRIADRLAEVKK